MIRQEEPWRLLEEIGNLACWLKEQAQNPKLLLMKPCIDKLHQEICYQVEDLALPPMRDVTNYDMPRRAVCRL